MPSLTTAESPTAKAEAIHLDYVNSPASSSSTNPNSHHHDYAHDHSSRTAHDHLHYHQTNPAPDGHPTAVVVTQDLIGQLVYLHDPTTQHTGAYAEHGPLIDDAGGNNLEQARPDLWWAKVRHTLREPLSEFFGTFILIMFGDGVVAQVVLSKSANGSYQSISWGWGLGVMLGVYTGGLSGAHLNPAVTFANCVFRKFPWRKFPIYMIAQILGAACASLVVYANYKSAIDVYEGGAGIRTVPPAANATAGIFCTYPQPFMTKTGQFFSEFIASTLLMFLIYALKDDGNLGAGNLTPLGLFFIIFGIGCAWGWETGYAINLARDFGPRLMSYGLGYGHEVWSAGNYYFWVPMVSPFFGTCFGGFLYDMFLFTGESPINTPWCGLKRVVRPRMKDWSTGAAQKAEDRGENV